MGKQVLIDAYADQAVVDLDQLVKALWANGWAKVEDAIWIKPEIPDAYSLLCADLVPESTRHDTDWQEPTGIARFYPLDHGAVLWALDINKEPTQ